MKGCELGLTVFIFEYIRGLVGIITVQTKRNTQVTKI